MTELLQIPKAAVPPDISKLDAFTNSLNLRGLTFKQRQFVLCYNGDQTVTVVIQSHEPEGASERVEYQRLERAMEEQTNAELISMGRQPPPSGSTCLSTHEDSSHDVIDAEPILDEAE